MENSYTRWRDLEDERLRKDRLKKRMAKLRQTKEYQPHPSRQSINKTQAR